MTSPANLNSASAVHPKLMVVGGGTGGHVYPGVAVAEAWLKNVPGGHVVFAGSPRGMEARVVPALGHPFIEVEARRLKNAGFVERLRSLIRMPMAILRGMKIVRDQRPTVVLGVGGYVSGPVVLAAALLGWPCAVAEQNARPGLTNRILGRFVRRIYTAFPEAGNSFPKAKVRELGNPVRAAFKADSTQNEDNGPRLLLLGGSQGARVLNERLPAIINALKERIPSLRVCHQTGRDRDADVRSRYEALGTADMTVMPFIDDMAAEVLAADLVVARAGATTVAELACVGRPALFIPFPHAADDHQTANAQSLVIAGAALLEQEATMDDDDLVGTLFDLFKDPERLSEMSSKAKGRGRPEAASAIVADLLELSGVEKGEAA